MRRYSCARGYVTSRVRIVTMRRRDVTLRLRGVVTDYGVEYSFGGTAAGVPADAWYNDASYAGLGCHSREGRGIDDLVQAFRYLGIDC